MTDYWKSIDKKFCNFCRTWITNNRASVDFHERGRRHKRNVEKKLKSATKQREADLKTENENAEILARLEQEAIKAYQKDLINNPDLMKAMITNQVPVAITDSIAAETPSTSPAIEEPEAGSSSTYVTYDPEYVEQLQRAKMSWEVVNVTEIEDPEESDEYGNDSEHNLVIRSQEPEANTVEPEQKQKQFQEKVLETNLEDNKETCFFKKRKIFQKNLRSRKNV